MRSNVQYVNFLISVLDMPSRSYLRIPGGGKANDASSRKVDRCMTYFRRAPGHVPIQLTAIIVFDRQLRERDCLSKQL